MIASSLSCFSAYSDNLKLIRGRFNGHLHRGFEIGYSDLAKAFGPERLPPDPLKVVA
jgi:hypothetical protein